MENCLIESKVCDFFTRNSINPSNTPILVAVSGGADSVALLLAMQRIGIKCIMAHCNFHLRGEESMRDQFFVRSVATKLGLECVMTDFDVPQYMHEHGVSVEMAARELRYNWFEKIRIQFDCQWIAVAHHQDDNIETFFLNALRGSGITGLKAISEINGNIIRPLLNVSRNDIIAYLQFLNQDYVIDSTNAENDVKRNKLRNIILPTLRDVFPDADVAIARTIENIKGGYEVYHAAINEFIEQATIKIDNLAVRINMAKFASHPGASTIMHEIVKSYGFNSIQSDSMLNAWRSTNSSGRKFYSLSHEAIINRSYIDIGVIKQDCIPQSYPINIDKCENPIFLTCRKITIDSNMSKNRINRKTEKFHPDILHSKLELRKWRMGDAIKPFGMRGTKKVSDLLSDAKLSIIEKRDIWVLTADESIVWVVGLRRSSLYPLCNNSTEAIEFCIP